MLRPQSCLIGRVSTVQLFNFHAAGSGLRSYVAANVSRTATGSSFEPLGNNNRDCSVVCLSWNKGHCVARTAVCRLSTFVQNVLHRIATSNAKHCQRQSHRFPMRAPKSVVSDVTMLSWLYALFCFTCILYFLHLLALLPGLRLLSGSELCFCLCLVYWNTFV